jgi:basic amino acid/polyamine antiporter, APA family
MPGLKKELGLFEVTTYGVGIILGAGIYALVGEGAGITGNSLWLSFIIGAVIAGFTGLSYAELASMFPKAAAEYVYVNNGFGMKSLAFLIGWLILFTGVATVATVALGFAGYFHGLFGINVMLTAILLILSLSYLNFLGIKHSSRLNVVFTCIEVSGLLLVIILAFFNRDKIVSIDYLQMKNGVSGILSAAALVFFAYVGFEDIANIAEETKNSRRILAKAFILAVVITTVLYVLTSVATVSLATPAELSTSTSPLALAVSKTFLGHYAFILMSFIALFATANTVLVAMIVGSRMAYGMARDKALPHMLSRIDQKRGSPYMAIVIFMLLSLLFLSVGGINFVASISSLSAFLTFALVNSSLLLLRFKDTSTVRSFRSPVNIGEFPVLAFLGLVTSIFMMFQFKLDAILFTAIVIGVGLICYLLFIKVRH